MSVFLSKEEVLKLGQETAELKIQLHKEADSFLKAIEDAEKNIKEGINGGIDGYS
jgi:hypothetical protein